jgi:hypothetical protein
MSKLLATLVVALAACSPVHDVQILFGPNEESLTIGFRCYRDDTNELMVNRVRQTGQLSVVIELFVVQGQGFPGCRGEELLATCGDGACVRTTRFCGDVTAASIDFTDPARALANLHAQLRAVGYVTQDAPDEPTIIRVVGMAQSCAEIGDLPLDVDEAVGCAYSCPTLLDEVEGSVSVFLDALNDRCEQTVRACVLAY